VDFQKEFGDKLVMAMKEEKVSELVRFFHWLQERGHGTAVKLLDTGDLGTIEGFDEPALQVLVKIGQQEVGDHNMTWEHVDQLEMPVAEVNEKYQHLFRMSGDLHETMTPESSDIQYRVELVDGTLGRITELNNDRRMALVEHDDNRASMWYELDTLKPLNGPDVDRT
jgi:hypothetical protein